MRRILTLPLLLIVSAVLPAAAQTTTVAAGRYADFRQLMARKAPASTVDIAMTIRFPDEPRDRYPAIVLVHTLGGYLEANEGWHAEAFRREGFATLTYSSAASQRLRSGDIAAGWPSAVAEAYAALRLLADQPRIDASRIAIVGFSFGGEVAYLAALEPLRAALEAGKAGFAAHVAYYPAGVYAAAAGPGIYTGAPILMLLGEKDDNLPLAKVQGYLAHIRQAEAPSIEVMIYPGAYHAWTVPTLGAAQFYPQYPSTRRCPYILIGPSRPALLVDGKPTPIEAGSLRDCTHEGAGYTMGYDEPMRAKALGDALAFLRRTLRPA